MRVSLLDQRRDDWVKNTVNAKTQDSRAMQRHRAAPAAG
jgi:hypothetical protein